jgi:hypothetical protein
LAVFRTVTSFSPPGDIKQRQVTIEAGKQVLVLPSSERPGFYRVETLVFPVIAGFIPCTHVRLNASTTPSTTPKGPRKADAERELPRKSSEQNVAKAVSLVLGGKVPAPRKPISNSDGWHGKPQRPAPPPFRPEPGSGEEESEKRSLSGSLPLLTRSSGSRHSPRTEGSASAPRSPGKEGLPPGPMSPISPKMSAHQQPPPVLVLPNAEEVHRHKLEVSKALEGQGHPPVPIGMMKVKVRKSILFLQRPSHFSPVVATFVTLLLFPPFLFVESLFLCSLSFLKGWARQQRSPARPLCRQLCVCDESVFRLCNSGRVSGKRRHKRKRDERHFSNCFSFVKSCACGLGCSGQIAPNDAAQIIHQSQLARVQVGSRRPLGAGHKPRGGKGASGALLEE